MPDLNDLAVQAREALDGARCATLLVDGYGTGTGRGLDESVTLHEHGGVPTLFCAADSALTRAAREGARAMLRVQLPVDDGPLTTVILIGGLELTRTERVDGVAVSVLTLVPATVLLERDHGAGRPLAQIEIPVRLYLRCGSEDGGQDMAQAVRRVRAHLNQAHQAQLRCFVAAHEGLRPGDVAGAELVTLTDEGALVHWVGREGAGSIELRFPARVRSSRELAVALRGQLSIGEQVPRIG
jgi:hypothetical protein